MFTEIAVAHLVRKYGVKRVYDSRLARSVAWDQALLDAQQLDGFERGIMTIAKEWVGTLPAYLTIKDPVQTDLFGEKDEEEKQSDETSNEHAGDSSRELPNEEGTPDVPSSGEGSDDPSGGGRG